MSKVYQGLEGLDNPKFTEENIVANVILLILVLHFFDAHAEHCSSDPFLELKPLIDRVTTSTKLTRTSCANSSTILPVDFVEVDKSCQESFSNSWNSIPANLKTCVYNSNIRIGFQKVSSDYMKSLTFSSWTTGVPTMACGGHTIITTSEYCSRFDYNLTHEIGHAIHDIIRKKYPKIYLEWEKIWKEEHSKNGGISFGSTKQPDLKNYLSWKDTMDPFEGFAEMVKFLSRPDTYKASGDSQVKKLNFGKNIRCGL